MGWPRDVGAQDEGVGEEADEVVEGLVGASRDGGADGDVVACAVAAEQGGEGGLDEHEHAMWSDARANSMSAWCSSGRAV